MAAVTPPNSSATSPAPLPSALDPERLCLQHFNSAVIDLLTEFLGHDLKQWKMGTYDKWSEDVPRGGGFQHNVSVAAVQRPIMFDDVSWELVNAAGLVRALSF